jgi:hypothetical protein
VDRLEIYLTELAQVLRHNNYLIGHIKGYVTFDNGGGIGLSIVKDKVNTKPQSYNPEAASSSFKLALTCIVFNISQEELSILADLGLAISLPIATFDDKVEKQKSEEVEK